MTVDRLPQGVGEGPESDRGHDGLPAATILSICDRLLGEAGRRSHMFTWLRVPGPSAREWLAVDAYYPRARLVVMCRTGPGPHDALYRQLIPARGLGLLRIDPAALGDDPADVEAALTTRILRPDSPGSGTGVSMASASAHAPEAGGRAGIPVAVERIALPPAVGHGLEVLVGMALAVVLFAELYLAVVVVALNAGRPLLGVAIVLEACSRGLGTVAAERAGRRDWAAACAIVGAPAVAGFALSPRARRAEVELAPIAGLLAVLAAVLALLGLALGS